MSWNIGHRHYRYFCVYLHLTQPPFSCPPFAASALRFDSSGTNGAVIEVSHNNAAQSPMFQGVDELAEMDDWGSAWQDAKEKGEGWGGRGKGGRGIQRNTWQPKDIFVEGEGRGVTRNLLKRLRGQGVIRRRNNRTALSRTQQGAGGEENVSQNQYHRYCHPPDCRRCYGDPYCGDCSVIPVVLPDWAVAVARFADWLCGLRFADGCSSGDDSWLVAVTLPIVAVLVALVAVAESSCISGDNSRRLLPAQQKLNIYVR